MKFYIYSMLPPNKGQGVFSSGHVIGEATSVHTTIF